jgi:hypothetical protein
MEQLNSMSRPPKWAYFIAGILIMMSSLLGVTIIFVLLEMLPRGMDIQMPLFYIILPLSILIPLIVLTMAIALTRKRE